MTGPAVAIYGSGPRFLIGYSPTRLVLRRGSFACVPHDAEDPSAATAALLVWRRRDLRAWSADRVELRHATLEVGSIVPIAAVSSDSPGFTGVRLPPGWATGDRMLFVVD